MPDDLDDEFGQPAKPGDLDPTHLVAIGTRLGTLDGNMNLLREEGHRRDDKITGVSEKVQEVDDKVEEVKAITLGTRETLGKLVKDENDLTNYRAMVEGRNFRKTMFSWLRRYGGYGAAVAVTSWTLREPIMKLLAWLGKVAP